MSKKLMYLWSLYIVSIRCKPKDVWCRLCWTMENNSSPGRTWQIFVYLKDNVRNPPSTPFVSLWLSLNFSTNNSHCGTTAIKTYFSVLRNTWFSLVKYSVIYICKLHNWQSLATNFLRSICSIYLSFDLCLCVILSICMVMILYSFT